MSELVVSSADCLCVSVSGNCVRPTSTFQIRTIFEKKRGKRRRYVPLSRKRSNYLPDDRAESHERAERWCLCYPGSGTAMQLSPLFRSLSFRHPRSLALLTPARPPPPRFTPHDRRSCTSILRDSPFSIYFPRLAPRFSLQMSPRGRLTFAPSPSFFLSFSLLFSLPSPALLASFRSFLRPFDWREHLTTGWPLTTRP